MLFFLYRCIASAWHPPPPPSPKKKINSWIWLDSSLWIPASRLKSALYKIIIQYHLVTNVYIHTHTNARTHTPNTCKGTKDGGKWIKNNNIDLEIALYFTHQSLLYIVNKYIWTIFTYIILSFFIYNWPQYSSSVTTHITEAHIYVCMYMYVYIHSSKTSLKSSSLLLNLMKGIWTGGRKLGLTHSEWRPQNIYSQEDINLDCIIKLATKISLFSLQISKTWCFV